MEFPTENNITSEISIEIDLQVISSSQNIRNRFHIVINDLELRVMSIRITSKGLKNRETDNYFIRINPPKKILVLARERIESMFLPLE